MTLKGESAVVWDEESFFERISEEKRLLYGIAYSYVRSEADALEMLQEATCRAWIKRGSLKDPAKFRSWLTRILINCCLDELKRRKRAGEGWERSRETGGETMEMASGRKLDMERALDAVKPKYRQVLLLKYYRDFTIGEIAEVLGKPEGTVKTWLNKGLQQLRDKMKARGLG